MRKIYTVIMLVLISTFTAAQPPQAITYQAIARNLYGDPLINQDIAIKISILQGTELGPVVYSEIHEKATNSLGLFNLKIGDPIEIVSGNFSEIGWGINTFFLKVEIDPTASGTSYQLMGVSQFVSVPYALYAQEAGNAQNFVAGTGINIDEGVISNTAPDKTVAVASGTGISASGTYPNFMVTNTSPDQNVTLTSGFGITTSGTYPNFTITNSKPNATHTGDVSGTTELTVTGIQGRYVSNQAPTLNQVYKYDGTRWMPSTLESYTAGAGISINGSNVISANDISPTNEIQNLSLDGNSLSISNGNTVALPTTLPIGASGNTLRHNGTSWTANSFLYNDGTNLGIGTTSPSAKLTLSNGSFLATGSSGETPVLGSGTRMMWIPSKGAFRAGKVGGTQWDNDSIGGYSVAFGNNSRALANYSAAFGNGTRASGNTSTAMGYNTLAAGSYSLAAGHSTEATGNYSSAFGYSSTAEGVYSFAAGYYNHSTGDNSFTAGYSNEATQEYGIAIGNNNLSSGASAFATGNLTEASGSISSTFGYSTTASGSYSSAFGHSTLASGNGSSAFGINTTSQSYSSLVIGRYNELDGTNDSWITSDPLFVAGNGTSPSARSNAFTILKDGRTGINVANPTYMFEIQNTNVSRSAYFNSLYSGASDKIGLRNVLSEDGTSARYGIKNYVYANPNSDKTSYGIYNYVDPNSSSGDVYGLFTIIPETGTGNRYGLYASAEGGWAGYFSAGDIYVEDNVEILGDLYVDGAAGINTPSVAQGYEFGVSGSGYFTNSLGVGTTTIPAGYELGVSGDGYFSGSLGVGESSLSSGYEFGVSGDGYFTSSLRVGLTTMPAGYQLGVGGDGYVRGTLAVGYENVPAGYKMSVDGKLICEEVKVELSTDWPDYVFDESYRLLPLHELEKSIKHHHHLPGLPSSVEVEKDGLNLSEMTTKLTEKIEELTLYLLEVNRKVEDLQKENEWLKKQISGK